MKKIFFIIVFAIALVFALSACSITSNDDNHTCIAGEPETNILEQPTCNNNGKAELITSCTICGEIIERNEIIIEKLTHTPGIAKKTWEQEATCYQEGIYYEVLYCSDCYAMISRTKKTVPKTNEHWERKKEENRIEPTCTANGSYELVTYCNYHGCGEELSRESIILEMISHTAANPVSENVVAPTCTEAGSHDAVEYCKDCNIELSRIEVIDSATGHSPATAVKENEIFISCFEEGSYDSVVYCETCSQELSRTEVTVKAAHKNDEYGICVICDPNASRGLKIIGGSVTGIGTCTDTDLVIPKYYNGYLVTKIGNAFGNYSSGGGFRGIEFNSVTIPDSITEFADYAFVYTINHLYINMDVAQWCQIEWRTHLMNGVNGNPIICSKNVYFNGELLTDLIIPDGVTEIKFAAFKGAKNLQRVIIPDSVNVIGDFAFNDCANLKRVTLGKNLTHIGTRAFCCGLERDTADMYPVLEVVNHSSLAISVGDHSYGRIAKGAVEVHKGELGEIKTVGDFVFLECGNGNNYLIKYIGSEKEFLALPENYNGGCYGITNFAIDTTVDTIVIPASVNKIMPYALGYDNSEINVYYSSGIEDWCKIQIYIYTYGSVVYRGGVLSKNRKLFINGELVRKVVIPGEVTEIANNAFCDYDYLSEVVISDGVESIGFAAFSGCIGLTSVEIPNSVTSIGDGAFIGCNGLTSVEIPNSVTSIGDWVFDGCNGLTSVEIPNSVTSIGDFAFDGCSSLNSIIIPKSIKSIGYDAFGDCTLLTDVYYIGTEEEWAEIAIDSGFPLDNVTIHYNYVPEE